MTDVRKVRDTRVRGRVAGILNERELLINLGSDHGVTPGMQFKVLAGEAAQVRDPETDEILGTIEQEKVRVAVTQVQPRFCVARTFRKRYIPGGVMYEMFHGSASAAGALRQLNREQLAPPREEVETLKAALSELLPPLPESESFVKKGDPVVQVLPIEEDS